MSGATGPVGPADQLARPELRAGGGGGGCGRGSRDAYAERGALEGLQRHGRQQPDPVFGDGPGNVERIQIAASYNSRFAVADADCGEHRTDDCGGWTTYTTTLGMFLLWNG